MKGHLPFCWVVSIDLTRQWGASVWESFEGIEEVEVEWDEVWKWGGYMIYWVIEVVEWLDVTESVVFLSLFEPQLTILKEEVCNSRYAYATIVLLYPGSNHAPHTPAPGSPRPGDICPIATSQTYFPSFDIVFILLITTSLTGQAVLFPVSPSCLDRDSYIRSQHL